jgi:hypothetical protein
VFIFCVNLKSCIINISYHRNTLKSEHQSLPRNVAHLPCISEALNYNLSPGTRHLLGGRLQTIIFQINSVQSVLLSECMDQGPSREANRYKGIQETPHIL